MKTLLTSLLALTLCSPFSALSAEPTAVTKAAHEIRIPKVELRGATLNEAISFLNKKSIECDAQKKGVNIAVAGEVKPDATISMSVIDGSVYDILTVVAAQVGMEIEPTETILMIVPKKK
jgi:hypothetical protein